MQARWTAGMATAMALALMMAAPLAMAKDDKASAEATQQRMEEAQRKLEEAARELAMLSSEMSGPMQQVFKIRHGAGGRAVLGINIDNAAPGTDGVRVVSVSPGGPAATAGMQAGDLIVALNGRKLAAGRELVEQMREVKPGDRVAVDLRRDGRPLALTVEAREAAGMVPQMDFELGDLGPHVMHGLAGLEGHAGMPFLLGPWGDAEFATMTPALGRYFGTDKGLLVVRSPKAAGAELEDGDVILSIGGREPQNGGHALRILRSYQPGESVDFKVLRQKKERTVKILVPEGPSHPGRRVVIRREGDKDHAGGPVILRKEVRKDAPPPPVPPTTGD